MLARNLDAIAALALSVLLVLVLPASEWPLRARLAAFAAIVLGVPTLVSAASFVARRHTIGETHD